MGKAKDEKSAANGSSTTTIMFGVVIMLLLVVIHNGSVHGKNDKAYKNYVAYVDQTTQDIDYEKLHEYSATHEDIEPTDENITEATPDPNNVVFQSCDGIYDKEFIDAQCTIAQQTGSDTGMFVTVDTGNYRLTIMSEIDGQWKAVACLECAVGNAENPTPLGMTHIGRKYAHYGGGTFVTLLDDQHQINNLYGGTGGEYSKKGNILLSECNAHFVLDTVPEGTPVVIHT